jgi:hypothetical protein
LNRRERGTYQKLGTFGKLCRSEHLLSEELLLRSAFSFQTAKYPFTAEDFSENELRIMNIKELHGR